MKGFFFLLTLWLILFPLRRVLLRHWRFSFPALLGAFLGFIVAVLTEVPGGKPLLLDLILIIVPALIIGENGQEYLKRVFPPEN
jgi:hypothetical protein